MTLSRGQSVMIFMTFLPLVHLYIILLYCMKLLEHEKLLKTFHLHTLPQRPTQKHTLKEERHTKKKFQVSGENFDINKIFFVTKRTLVYLPLHEIAPWAYILYASHGNWYVRDRSFNFNGKSLSLGEFVGIFWEPN